MKKLLTFLLFISFTTFAFCESNERINSTVHHRTNYAGHLSTDTASKYWANTTDIVIEGPMNDKDLQFLVKWATIAQLEKIDLKEVTGISIIHKGIFNKGNHIKPEDTLRLIKIVLPDAVSIIEDSAFMGCTKLQEIQFGNNIKTIGKNAFENCISLSNYFDMPQSVTEVGNGAFKGCTSIHGIIFPPLLKKINDEMCYGCKKLIHVGLDENIDTIGFQAFFECPIMKFECKANKPPYCASNPFAHAASCNVIIPDNSYYLYEADTWWKYARLITITDYTNN